MRSTLFIASVLLAVGQAAHAQQFVNQTAARFPAANNNEYTSQLCFVDIDGDGDLDILWANGQAYSSAGAALKPRVYVNDGTGVFTDQTDVRVAGITGWTRGIEAGDMDGDGDWDLILPQDFNKKPILLKNDGTGVFTNASAQLPSINLSSSRAQFGDIDNDGDLDLILCNSGTATRFSTNGRPRIYLNDGTGTFTDAPAAQTPAANVPEQMDILFFDCDNDLDLDIYVGSRASASQLWINNGAGTYTKLAAGMPVGGASYSYDSADIDGDGDMDLIGVNSAPGNQELLLKNANGLGTSWTTVSNLITPNPSVDDNDSRFFDIDFDGDLDLVVGSLGSTERIYQNNGTGAFAQAVGAITAVSDASLDVKVADLNADGRVDIVTAQGEAGSFQNKIFMNTTGAVDNRAPNVKLTEQVVPGNGAGPFNVRSEIFDDSANDRGYEFTAEAVKLIYTVNGGAPVEVVMLWKGAWLYRGTIPKQAPCSEVSYFVQATDRQGNVGVGPTKNFTVRGTCGNPADLDGDGLVNAADLAILLGAWGTAGPGDLNGDGIVDASDLAVVLGAWS
ncbi:MAG: FG-GAP-like repeat-containing protein [Phycisphaerae bacterium]|nr:FG-GAP-like repeat-containing protein [Phycisphaerae bacterium]